MQLFSSDAATFLKDIYISFAPKNMKLVLCTGLKWGGGVPPGGSVRPKPPFWFRPDTET
jgi:hypothetical protein